MNVTDRRNRLIEVLSADDPTEGLWALCDSGEAAEIVPELPALRLEQDPIHKHKDVLAHTIAVTAKTSPELVLRLAALFHDIGKPKTRSFQHGGVTFRHHEAVGAKIAKKRLRELEFDRQTVADAAELVRLSGRFKGFADGWSDSAVRRYARDAGPLLGQLTELVRSDCTTRNAKKAARIQGYVSELSERINELAQADRLAAERPQIDGKAVMDHFGVSGSRKVGLALNHMLEIKRSEGELSDDELFERLDAWWADNPGL